MKSSTTLLLVAFRLVEAFGRKSTQTEREWPRKFVIFVNSVNFQPDTLPDRITLKRLLIVLFKDYRTICKSIPLTCKWAGNIQRKQRPSNWNGIKFPMKLTEELHSLEKWGVLTVSTSPRWAASSDAVEGHPREEDSTSVDGSPTGCQSADETAIHQRPPALAAVRPLTRRSTRLTGRIQLKLSRYQLFTASAHLYGRSKWKWPLTACWHNSRWLHAAGDVTVDT